MSNSFRVSWFKRLYKNADNFRYLQSAINRDNPFFLLQLLYRFYYYSYRSFASWHKCINWHFSLGDCKSFKLWFSNHWTVHYFTSKNTNKQASKCYLPVRNHKSYAMCVCVWCVKFMQFRVTWSRWNSVNSKKWLFGSW